MKYLITTLFLSLAVVGLTNCGKKKGGSTYPPGSNAAHDANTVSYNDGSGNQVIWKESSNNIYVPVSQDCVKGLKQDADDNIASIKYEQLSGLINSSSVVPGTNTTDQPQTTDSPTITIETNSGETKTYALDQESASPQEEVLSNGNEIITYFEEVEDEIAVAGAIDCPGKTAK